MPESEPVAAMLDNKLAVQVKGEETREEGNQPSCQILGNFNPKDKPLCLK